LLQQADHASRASTIVEILTFDLSGEVFALEASQVREISDLPEEIFVPGAPAFAASVINFRGKVIPIADLRLAFGLKQGDVSPDSRIIVIEMDLDGDMTLVGLRADKVHEVATLDMAATEKCPRVGMRWREDFVRCVGRRGDDPIIIPDLPTVFAERGEAIANNVTHIRPVNGRGA